MVWDISLSNIPLASIILKLKKSANTIPNSNPNHNHNTNHKLV